MKFKGFRTDILNMIVVFLIVVVPIILLFSGCAQKEVVVKTIKTPGPILKTYEVNTSLKLTAVNWNGKVCVKEWNACLPKEEMKKLLVHIITLKKIVKLYTDEVKKYNNFAFEHNKKVPHFKN